MPYRVKVTLLAIGAVIGLTGGIRHMANGHRHKRANHEERMTQVCTEAAREACSCKAEAPAERGDKQNRAQP